LGLLPFVTRFGADKRTTQVCARAAQASFLSPTDVEVRGYEIHMGRLQRAADSNAAFSVVARNGAPDDDLDGAISENGAVVGTMLHGLFENASVRRALLSHLRVKKGLKEVSDVVDEGRRPDEYDRLADVLRNHVDMHLLLRIVGLPH
jgi:adenosylcobyric acid synthase